jgi:hypothetical protein
MQPSRTGSKSNLSKMKIIPLLLVTLMAARASAQMISVRVEMGLYSVPGPTFVLRHNDPVPFSEGGFLWRYENNRFSLTALFDEDTSQWGNDLLAVYPFGVTPISRFDEEMSRLGDGEGGPIFPLESNELGFITFRSFPSVAGESYSIPINHPDMAAAAVPEPSTWAVAGIIALGLACVVRRAKKKPIPC